MEPRHRCAPLPRGRYEPQAKLPYIVRLLRTVFVAAYAYVNGAEARASPLRRTPSEVRLPVPASRRFEHRAWTLEEACPVRNND